VKGPSVFSWANTAAADSRQITGTMTLRILVFISSALVCK
jgi:hypothetical protein